MKLIQQYGLFGQYWQFCCKLFTFNLALLDYCLLATALSTFTGHVHADIGASHTSLVSEFASFNTPGIVDGRVKAIAIDGDTVFVGGSFTQIKEPMNGETIDQPYLFAYSKSTGNVIRGFDPILDNEVRALETTGEGTGIFVGGAFSIFNGESNNRGLLKIANNGDRVASFISTTDGAVNTLVRHNNTLYVGGNFSEISTTLVERLAAVDTTTGSVLPSVNLDFEGRFFTDRNPNTVQGVDDIDIMSNGELMVVVGNFESINGISRPRLALLDLVDQASVSTWNTNVFDFQCGSSIFPQYIQGIDIAPDDSYFLTATNGGRRRAQPACDSIARYDFGDLTDTDVQPTWVNYTGGDSVYDVVATDHVVYAGGHFRWLTNDAFFGSDMQGPGSVERRGLGALDPVNGLTLLNWRSDRNPRGVGVFSMIAEPEGLYIGDDTDFLNGAEHAKLKFLPITTKRINRPDKPTLPTVLISNNGGALDTSPFDGINIENPTQLLNSNWEDAVGAMFVGGLLLHADVNGAMWMSRLTDGTFEPREPVDLFGLTSVEWDLTRLSGMFFDYIQSRVYYTLQGDSRLYWRAFTPDGPYFGNDDYFAEEQSDIPWRDITGMDIIDGYLYFTLTDSTLSRAEIDGVAPIAGTTEQISGPGIDALIWDNALLAFLSEGMLVSGALPNAELEFKSSGSQTSKRFSQFEFPVTAGEPVVLRLDWLDPNAMLRLFIRDGNDQFVASDTSLAGSPKYLTFTAGDDGTYTASVLIFEGSTSYTLQVNPSEAPPPAPEPLADFEFNSSGDQNAGRFQVFDFDVAAGELVELHVAWDDPNSNVSVFLRDETGTQVHRDNDGSGSPIALSTVAQTSGQWSVAVLIASGSANYLVLVDKTTDFEVPEPLADYEFSSSGSTTSGRFQVFDFDVVAGELVEARITWDEPSADIRVFLRDENNDQVAREIDGIGSAMVSTIAQSSGQWSVAVLVRGGSINYDIFVDTTTDFELPEPLADFEFSSSGTQVAADGRFRTFNFDVIAGETIDAQIRWDDVDADLRVFLRDESNTQVDRDTEGSGAATVSAVAASSGRWPC
jgi:hypothetical protein